MKKVSNFFYVKSTLLVAIIATVLVFGYVFFIFIDAAACFYLGNGEPETVGLSFGISYEALMTFLDARTTEMLLCFKEFNLVWDNIFALLYGLMYVIWLSLIFKPYSQKVKYLNLLPLLQSVFDWVENYELSIITETSMCCSVFQFQIDIVSVMLMAKWTVAAIIFFAILVGVIMRFKSYVNKRKSK